MDWETFYNGLISSQAGGQPPHFVMQKKEPVSPLPPPTHTHTHLCLAPLSVGSGQLEMVNWPPARSSILRESGAKGQLTGPVWIWPWAQS